MIDPALPFMSRRSPVYAMRGMVAASQPLAAQAGLEILMRGGNAADAAIATAAALNVTEPTSTGLGGDCFALFYDGETGKIAALNGSGRAPAGLTLDLLRRQGLDHALPPLHAHTITVPGACAGWCDLLEAHGTLDRPAVLAPAIRLAEEGFPVAPITAYFWERGAQRQLKNAPGGHELLLDGRAPRAGEIVSNRNLANTLRAIAEGGKEAFYQGQVAEKIAAKVQECGGVMSIDDLASHTSTWEVPISTVYKGIRVYECPPNGQGLAALLALNILSRFDLSSDPLSAERLHLVIEALRLAFADTAWYVADPAFSPAPLDALLSADYAAERVQLIDTRRAIMDQQHGVRVAGSDTVYFSVVDGQGSACSFINSNYMGFGTGIVPEGTGFSLQNRGHNFSLDPEHSNVLAPRKRPYHTIIPGMATRESDGSLYASFGVMGGFMQPQGHVQVALGLLDDGLDPQAALDRPRICIEDGTAGGQVALEEGIPTSVMSQLAAMGHRVRPVNGYDRTVFGRGQIILRDPRIGVLCGGSDPRADGCALGF
ncbi:MAG: gamma-glutamyltransferase [Anaerolineae bacterium]|nr:gamma-glutamyltransferase [Anaerolineae bacterium]